MEFIETYKSISDSDLLSVESELGFKLPDAYRSFLLQHNGGRPVLDGVCYKNEHFDFVGYFYAVRGETYHDDLIRQYKEYVGMIPLGYLPIADSPGGDAFCISLKEPSTGAIFHWDHEEANYDGEPWEYNMTKLAPSLAVFLAELRDGD